MKLDVKFAGNSRTFSAGFSGTTFIHGGQNGATFTPAVSADGVLSWTNDRELPNPAPVNIKGADGVGVARVYLKTIGMGDGAPSTYVVELTDSSIGGTISVTNGSKGSAGYTPVAGKDYFTAADKAEMVAAVIASLPVYGGETA